jgi:hypothetical protein
VVVPDVDAVVAKAEAMGGKVLSPAANYEHVRPTFNPTHEPPTFNQTHEPSIKQLLPTSNQTITSYLQANARTLNQTIHVFTVGPSFVLWSHVSISLFLFYDNRPPR